MTSFPTRLIPFSVVFLLAFSALADQGSITRTISESRYSRAHSLGDGYQFDPRDGWQAVNVTNLQYKYRRQLDNTSPALEGRAGKQSTPPPKKSVGGAVNDILHAALDGLKGIGKPEPVTITWYTGHDLENPSCWANGNWAPTDESFAAALTLNGWRDKPKCFKFLELCSTPKKCVFVRVVDTCAGCAQNSKHVDLTRAAFGQLASFEEGVLTVQFRQATEPRAWFEKLWGPKVPRK